MVSFVNCLLLSLAVYTQERGILGCMTMETFMSKSYTPIQPIFY